MAIVQFHNIVLVPVPARTTEPWCWCCPLNDDGFERYLQIESLLKKFIWMKPKLSLISSLGLSFLVVFFQSLICLAHQAWRTLTLYRGRVSVPKSLWAVGFFPIALQILMSCSHSFCSSGVWSPDPTDLHISQCHFLFARCETLWSSNTEYPRNLCQ